MTIRLIMPGSIFIILLTIDSWVMQNEYTKASYVYSCIISVVKVALIAYYIYLSVGDMNEYRQSISLNVTPLYSCMNAFVFALTLIFSILCIKQYHEQNAEKDIA